MTAVVSIRDLLDDDLDVFFEQQRDPDARWMAAFVPKDGANKEVFIAQWTRLRSNPSVVIRTILADGEIAGSFMGYEDIGRPEVSYWLGKEYWGRGIATEALRLFLKDVDTRRPIFARAAKDNAASLRVLAKCGFTILSEGMWHSYARGKEIEEYLLACGE